MVLSVLAFQTPTTAPGLRGCNEVASGPIFLSPCGQGLMRLAPSLGGEEGRAPPMAFADHIDPLAQSFFEARDSDDAGYLREQKEQLLGAMGDAGVVTTRRSGRVCA